MTDINVNFQLDKSIHARAKELALKKKQQSKHCILNGLKTVLNVKQVKQLYTMTMNETKTIMLNYKK